MASAEGTETHNAAGSRETQHQTEMADHSEELKWRLIGVASPKGLFGDVPNGAGAEQALQRAAEDMLAEAERAGMSVQNIVANAGSMAEIANMTDEEVTMQMKLQVGHDTCDCSCCVEFVYHGPYGPPVYQLY